VVNGHSQPLQIGVARSGSKHGTFGYRLSLASARRTLLLATRGRKLRAPNLAASREPQGRLGLH
jgi:hypothetical protein